MEPCLSGGTGTPDKHGYEWSIATGYYSALPIASDRGRFRGYIATFTTIFPREIRPSSGGSYTSSQPRLFVYIGPDGAVSGGPIAYRSPNAAAKACLAHAQKLGICKT